MTQYMTGNFICRLIGLCDVSRHDSVLEERCKTLVTWGFVRPLTWCLHNAIVTAIGRNCNCRCSCHATTVSPSIARIKHDCMVSCDCPCDCRTDFTNWNQSHRLAKWHDTWNAERRDFEVSRNCNYHVLWQMNHKEYGRKGPWDASLCYASVAHQLDSRTDLSPVPIRSAAKSYITSWCIQNLSKQSFEQRNSININDKIRQSTISPQHHHNDAVFPNTWYIRGS